MIFDYNEIIYDIFKRKNDLDKIGKKNKKFKVFKENMINNRFSFVNKYTKDSFEKGYIENICNIKKNKILAFCIDSEVNYRNVPTIIISRKVFRNKDKVKYAVLLIVTLPKYRCYGYGSSAMYDYFDFIKDNSRRVEVILHSLPKSKQFYLDIGFVKIEKSLFLQRIEDFEEDKDKILLKYII